MKKAILGASALVLSAALSAEESGAFVGVDLGVQSALMTSEQQLAGSSNKQTQETATAGNFRYGIMGGYKWFFTDSVGLRVYATISNSKNVLPAKAGTYDAPNFFANVDFLYNLFNEGENSFGLFAGLSFGYSVYSGGIVKKTQDDMKTLTGKKIEPSGFDAGINFGLRGIVAKNHGVELFTRFGVYHTQGKISSDVANVKMWIDQPYAFGARYTFNF